MHNICKLCSHAHHDLHHSVIVITYLQSIVTAIHEYETNTCLYLQLKRITNSHNHQQANEIYILHSQIL